MRPFPRAGTWYAAGAWVLTAATSSCTSLPQAPDLSDRPTPGIPTNAWDEDLAGKRILDSIGEARTGTDVVLWYPKDSLSDAQATEIVARLDKGIVAAKRIIGKPDWNVQDDRRMHFYCLPGNFISHAPGGNCAFIPVWRMQQDQSPWLHEAMHLLLKTDKGDWLQQEDSVAMRRMPLWLSEGMADALAMDISEQEHLIYYSPLIDVPPAATDSLALVVLRDAPSDSVLAYIGARGKLPQLWGPDRFSYALPFYTGSASFTRYIAKHHGYAPLLKANDAFNQEIDVLERELAMPMDSVKARWLAAIGYSDQPHH